MKNTKHRENETMSKFNDFLSKINKSKAGNNTVPIEVAIESKNALKKGQEWMAKPIKFQVTSDKAYEVQKAKEYEQTVGTGKNFENFVTKGDSAMQMQFNKMSRD